MVVLSILLAISIVSLTIYAFNFRTVGISGLEAFLLLIISFISSLGAVTAVLLLRPTSILNVKLKQAEDSLDDLKRLNNTLRSQRHDFLNHLQVVHSLIELKEYSEANDYIEKVYTCIEKVNSTLKTAFPAVNAILEAKRQACERYGIDIVVEVRTDLTDVSIPAWELCRIFGNIIDNSTNALSGKQDGGKVRIEIYEDMISYGFKVSNNGPAIPPELWKKIFEPGYKSKESKGEGMGLHICKNIIERYNGKIRVFSDETETVFEGSIPRK